VVRKQWAENVERRRELDGRLAEAAGWFRTGAVSSRVPYELHRLADVYDGWPTQTPSQALARVNALQRDAWRIIDKKRPPGTEDQMNEIRDALHACVSTPDELRELAAELLIARHLAVALRQSGGNTP
jgi:hypothetical protein